MKRSGILFGLALVTGACDDRLPAGKVLAVVDGQAVTQGDVTTDLLARRPFAGDIGRLDGRVRQAMTALLVDRKLLAERARRDAVDEDPAYAALVVRAQETVLVQRLLAGWRARVPAPSVAEIRSFMDRNPQMFADRVIYLLDEIQTDRRGLDENAFGPMGSMEAVAEYLHRGDRPFLRAASSLDTAMIGIPSARQLAALTPGKPLLAGRGTVLTIKSVLRATPSPLAGEQGARIAAGLLEQSRFQELVRRNLASLRSAATITYPATAAPGTAVPGG